METLSNIPLCLVKSSRGLLWQINEYFKNVTSRRGRRSCPSIEEPSEEKQSYDPILPEREYTPESDAESNKELPRNPQHPDQVVPENGTSLPTYASENESALPTDPRGENIHPWTRLIDPSMEEDIPLRPSEVDIPHEIQYSGKNREFPRDPGTKKPELERPDEAPEIENPMEGPEIEKRDEGPEIETPDQGQEISRPAKREIDPDQART
jgi:hypothetical protein